MNTGHQRIAIDRGIYDFYKEYFDGIITIAKE